MDMPLTKEESAFAAEHHNLVYAFLKMKRYPVDEFYDIAIFGYLRAVRTYLGREDLRDLYKFSTIAYKRMGSSISSHFTALNRQMRKADTHPYDDNTDVADYSDSVFESVSRKETSDAVRETLSEILTTRQNEMLCLKNEGYTNREIGERCGRNRNLVGLEIKAAGNAIRERAPELRELIAA